MNKKYFIVLFLSITVVRLNAQTYPVTVNAQLIPPYSVYLSEYLSPDNEKLFVSLLFNDLTIPTYNVKLRITIEGVGIKIETRPEAQIPPIAINSGMLERLGASEMLPYFDANNLIFQGITKQQYQKNAALPESFYKFCIQAFDYNRNVAVSNKACVNAWLILNDPPRINTPVCNGIIKAIYPQNIVFQWLPMHLGSPNAVAKTEYIFKLVHIRSKGMNPNDAINTSFPIFEVATENSILYYGISEPQLTPGEQYVWQVQAKDTGGKDLFKNNGLSEACLFTYGEPCKPPLRSAVEIQNSKRVRISWDPLAGPDKFIVKYRVKNDKSASWFENESYTNSSNLSELKPGTLYEYKILSICNPVESNYSQADTFTTSSLPVTDECGNTVTTNSIDNTTQLLTLLPNDVFVVDGFNVRVVSATGSDGTFSGDGIAYIPFLGINVRMSFRGIKINANHQVYKGKVNSDKASIVKYRNLIPSTALMNDICQEAASENPNNPNSKDVKISDVKKGMDASPKDSIKVIVVNGKVQIKEGDTIVVNGKSVIVTKDTQIKAGDVVVVGGQTLKVDKTEKNNAAVNSDASPEFMIQVKEIVTEIRDAKYDSLSSIKGQFLSDIRRLKMSSSTSMSEFGTGTKAPLNDNDASIRSFKPIILKVKGSADPEQLDFNKKKNMIMSLYGSIAASNEILKSENIEKFSSQVLAEVTKDGSKNDLKNSKVELQRIIQNLIIRYKEENFN